VAAFVLFALSGFCQSVVGTSGRALLARVTPLAVLGRVFGVLEGLAMAGLAVGSLMVPALVAVGGVRLALIGVAVVLVVAALAPATRLRALDQFVPAESGLNAVRGHSLFAALPAPVIEGLARALSPEPTRPGQVVIAEGDVGDRFYLIAEGEFDVSVTGEHLRSLGPGDGFGEIALMRQVLRTATVVARTSGLLYALERQPFIDALRPAI
jgi:MFS family permease